MDMRPTNIPGVLNTVLLEFETLCEELRHGESPLLLGMQHQIDFVP